MDEPAPVEPRLRQLSIESHESDSHSEESAHSGDSGEPVEDRSRSISTTATSPSPGPAHSAPKPPVVGGAPFGYLDASTNFPAPAAPATLGQAAFTPPPPPQTWGSRSGPLIANPNLPPVPLNLAAQAEPIYPHAYVTFGAGMRQKEVDTYTANHPLEVCLMLFALALPTANCGPGTLSGGPQHDYPLSCALVSRPLPILRR